jgi:hypothetical protein
MLIEVEKILTPWEGELQSSPFVASMQCWVFVMTSRTVTITLL